VVRVPDYEHLAERLDQIAEDLDELAFDQLREAVADGEVQRPRSDKTLMQARRSVAKAAHLLRSIMD
jgi:predicted transcriptional regulator